MRTFRTILPLFLASSLVTACNSEGASVLPAGNDEICTLQKKSVCEQGKGHKFLGGECPMAGYAKKSGDGIWEKK